MIEEEICPLLSLKKGEKELHPCLGSRCGWYSEINMTCGIKKIAEDMSTDLSVTVDEMCDVPVYIMT